MNLSIFQTVELQNFTALLTECESHGVLTVGKIKSVVEKTIRSRMVTAGKDNPAVIAETKRVVRETALLTCPDCGSMLALVEVNVSRCTRMDEPYKSALICADRVGCGYSSYRYETVDELLKGGK